MIHQILLSITFVYGPLYLLFISHPFKVRMETILISILPSHNKIFIYLGNLFFYFSLCYQAYY